jgi:KDO2-lipid IV(A) lauroyltransferase
VARANLERALGATHGARDRHAIEKEAYAHLGESLIEFLWLARAQRATLAARIDTQGEENLQRALEAGHGAIVASGHFGNWELCGAALAARGYPVTFVVQPLRNARVDALVNSIRCGTGIEVLPRGMALRRVAAALESNRLVFWMCDQDARRHGIFVRFFGVPASTPKGAAQMALRRRVPFLTALGVRGSAGRHRLVLGAPIPRPAPELQEEEAVRHVLEAFNTRLEDAIRTTPSQYWWAHRRWKTAPPALDPVLGLTVAEG